MYLMESIDHNVQLMSVILFHRALIEPFDPESHWGEGVSFISCFKARLTWVIINSIFSPIHNECFNKFIKYVG